MKRNTSLHKRQAIFVIFLSIIPILFVGVGNFVVDPMQVYRKQRFVTPRFWTEQRFQNAGKINSYLSQDGYEAVIIGHSHVDNFIPSQVQKLLHLGKTLKLTINGSTPREQYLMVSKALEKGKIKTVLWGIGLNFRERNPFRYNENRLFPQYLYSESILDDYPYLLSTDIFNFAVRLIQNQSTWSTDLDRLNYWMPEQVKNYTKFSSVENLNKLRVQLKKSNVYRLRDFTGIGIDNFPNVDFNLLSIVKKYPDVNFILFFPPPYYFRLTSHSTYKEWLSLQKTVVEAMDQFSNVEIYGFDNNHLVGGNAANYRDFGHYHSGVNIYMLESMRDGRSRLTSSSFNDYESKTRKNLLEFEIYSNFKTMIPMAFPQEKEALFATLKGNELKEDLNYAIELYRNKEFADALDKFDKIVDKVNLLNEKSIARAFYFRGNVHMKLNDFDKAIDDFDKAVAIDQNFANAYVSRGKAFLKLNKVGAAEKDFEHYITIKPLHFRGYWLLGKLNVKKENYRQAIILMTKAIELNPKDARLYRDRATIYTKMGNTAKSEEDYKKSRHVECESKLTPKKN